MPILDAPQYLQLHAALDTFSSLPFSVSSQALSADSSVFWLDREVMSAAFQTMLAKPQPPEEDARRRRIREIVEEGWDIFLRVLGDGSLVVQAVAVRVIIRHIHVVFLLNSCIAHRSTAPDASQAIHPVTNRAWGLSGTSEPSLCGAKPRERLAHPDHVTPSHIVRAYGPSFLRRRRGWTETHCIGLGAYTRGRSGR